MNRYVLEGMVRDFLAGRTVVYVGTRADWLRTEDALRAVLCSECVEVTARVGECVHGESGGRFVFRSTERRGLRGLEADVVYFDMCEVPETLLVDALQVVAPRGGEVMRSC